MLPTPDTSHVPFSHIYEPAEDSYLLLDTLSSPSETAFLTPRFLSSTTAPLVLEVGSGSGVVVSFIHAHAQTLFGTRNVLTAAVDANPFACGATAQTARVAQGENSSTHGIWLDAVAGDLVTPWRAGMVDVLVFNPPYVPTDEMPGAPGDSDTAEGGGRAPQTGKPPGSSKKTKSGLTYEQESYLLSLSYAGGLDGMEVTNRLIDALPDVLSDRGCAYILLCARNKPAEVKERIKQLGSGRTSGGGQWMAETVGESGAKAGWEKLCIVRVWRGDDGIEQPAAS